MKVLSSSGKYFGIRKFGSIALIVAIAAVASPYSAIAARRHHAAAKAQAPDEETNANASSTALGAYSEACVIEPVTGTVIFESNDHAPWPTASLAKMMLMLIVAEKISKACADAASGVIANRRASLSGARTRHM